MTRSRVQFGRCSPIQERWYRVREANSAFSTSAPFLIVNDWTIAGKIDPGRMAAALTQLGLRQWSLRTVIAREGERLVQAVLDPSVLPDLEVFDCRDRGPDGGRLEEILRHLHGSPVDVSAGRPFRAGLIILADDNHRLILAIDHLVSDGTSGHTLHRDLLWLYETACSTGDVARDRVLPPLPRQYVHWAEHQWQLLAGDYGTGLRRYWTERLGDTPGVTLPADASADADLGPAIVCRDWLGGELFTHVSALTRQESAGSRRSRPEQLIGMVAQRPLAFLSVYFALILRITGQRDLCINVPTSARTRDTAGVIGHFTVPLIVRVTIGENMSFRDLFARVRAAFADAQPWCAVPLYAALIPRREVWAVGFNYQRLMRTQQREGLLRSAPTLEPFERQAYLDLDLVLSVHELGEERRARMTLTARGDVFRIDTLHKFAREYGTLARSLLISPDAPIS